MKSHTTKSKTSKVNVMGQDVEISQQMKSADEQKEVTYTSNDEEESYEPDFQSEMEGPFTPEE